MGRLADLFPGARSVSRGGATYTAGDSNVGGLGFVAEDASVISRATYTAPDDPTLSGARMEVGDTWVDTSTGKAGVWTGNRWEWPSVATDSANGRPRRRVPATEDDGSTRLGPHRARRTGDGGWACGQCGFESMDAGVLAETECEE